MRNICGHFGVSVCEIGVGIPSCWSEGQGLHQTNPQKSRLVTEQDLLQGSRGEEQEEDLLQEMQRRREGAQGRVVFTAEQSRMIEQDLLEEEQRMQGRQSCINCRIGDQSRAEQDAQN